MIEAQRPHGDAESLAQLVAVFDHAGDAGEFFHHLGTRLRAAGRRPSLVALSAATREDESVDAAMDRLATTGKAVSASVSQPDPESAAVGAWTRRRLHEALAGMPEDERTVIVMAYDDELSQSEIAGRLGWPIGTVKTRTRRALRRLRQAFFLKVRDDTPLESIQARMHGMLADGRLDLGRKDPRFWPAAGLVLDLLVLTEARISAAAESLGISTANLVSFLETDPKLWEQANQLRARFNQKALRPG